MELQFNWAGLWLKTDRSQILSIDLFLFCLHWHKLFTLTVIFSTM